MMKQGMHQQSAEHTVRFQETKWSSRLAWLVVIVGILSGGGSSRAAEDKQMRLTYSVKSVTCDVDVPPSLTLNSMNVGMVTGASPVKATGMKFNVTLHCDGGAAPKGSSVGVWGTPDITGNYAQLYKNENTGPGAAAGVGFVLTNDSDGSGPLLKAGTKAAPTVVVAGKVGDTLDSKSIPFFIMPYRGGYSASVVEAGTLKATLNFDFQWE
ncbi:fimbrial protein [Enterobacter ludwigii]|uniref:fimbrial protein n=1 Tax=Enterobacter ludwigii TaxID=299767 RepID=UPI001868EBC5|nr:fimbrial protein [Enterobacter ludwigii]